MPRRNATRAGDADSQTSAICRVLIVDDHHLFRNGLRELLMTDPSLDVCGEAASIQEALQKLDEVRPDLVTVDISLADGNGLALVARIKEEYPATTVLVLSMHEEGVYAERAAAAGAAGYVCKQASNEEICEAVRTVRRNGVYFSQQILQRLAQRKTTAEQTPMSVESQLSTRELEIFTLIGQGNNTQTIAQNLKLSASTIETYRERIKSKLALANGAELTHRAIVWVMNGDDEGVV